MHFYGEISLIRKKSTLNFVALCAIFILRKCRWLLTIVCYSPNKTVDTFTNYLARLWHYLSVAGMFSIAKTSLFIYTLPYLVANSYFPMENAFSKLHFSVHFTILLYLQIQKGSWSSTIKQKNNNIQSDRVFSFWTVGDPRESRKFPTKWKTLSDIPTLTIIQDPNHTTQQL